MVKKMSKKAKIIRHIAKYPEATNECVANRVGSTAKSVSTIRYKFKDEIAAKQRELMEDTQEQMVLDLADYPMITDHIPQSDIDALLDERGAVYAGYGKFADLAEVVQRFKESLHYSLIARDKRLAADQQESLEMIFHKVARIINGDADYVDSWKDIAGYATLVSDRLEGNAR